MEESSFFNDVDGDRIYYAEDFAEYFIPFFTNGIFNNGCQVLGNTNDMAVNVSTGRAFINGYRYRNKQSKTLTIENADGVLSRIDNIVIRLDLTNRNISTQVIKGSFSNNPVAPDLTRTSTIYDLRIAKIYIPAGTTEITQDLIEDCRFINSDCGNVISPIKTPDTEQLFIQMQAIFDKFIADSTNGFDTWFDSIKNQLDSDAAGNLQNQINNLNSNKVDNAKYDLDSNNLQLLANGKNVGDSVHIPTGITDTATGEEDLKIVNNKGVAKFSLEGKTEQKSYTGKNIFNYITTLVSSDYGLTSKINTDGSITTTGKITRDYASIVSGYVITDELEDGETYTLSQAIANDKVYAQINARKKSDNTYTYIVLGGGTNKSKSFKVDKTTYASYTIGVQTNTMAQWGDESLTITNKYMLCKGTDTVDTSFEPYVGATPSPNPDYPQEIESVRGVENLLEINCDNQNEKGIELINNNDGSVTLNGTSTAKSGGIRLIKNNTSFSVKKLPSEVTFSLPEPLPSGVELAMAYGDENGTWVKNIVILKDNDISKSIKLDIPNNAKYVRFNFTIESGIVLNNITFRPLLEKGNKQHYFVPYGNNYLQLKNVGKNLFNYTPVLITQVKSNLRTNNIYPNSNILLKKGTYILSFPDMVMKNNIKEFGVQLFDNNTQLATLTLSNNKKSAIFTINNDANINRLYTYVDNSDNNDATITYKNIQLEKGTVATDYEPYEEKNIIVDLQGNELCSNLEKTTNDDLIVENSKAKINKKIKEFTFTGEEEFNKRNDGDGSTTITFNLPIHEDVVELNTVSNMFSYEQSSTSGNEGMGVSIGNNKLVYIQIKRSRLSSLDVAGFKEFLKAKYNAGTPLKIQCELIEPEVVDLGEVDFELLEGNSTLNLEEDLKSNMSIKYYTDSTVVDLKKKVENKQNVILHGATAPTNDLGEDGDIYLQHN